MTAPAAQRVAPGSGGTVRVALLAAGGCGALVALQQRLNGELGETVGSALVAALVSFATGMGAVAAVVLARPAARRALAHLRSVPWWQRLGGLGGTALVAVGAVAAPRLGVALLTVGLVAGQTGGGLLVDRAGLGPGGRRPVTGPRLAGALLCLVAVAVPGLSGTVTSPGDPALLALVVGAGLLVALQQALNGQVRAATDGTVTTLLNFTLGTAVLAAAVALTRPDLSAGPWPGPGRWYLYAGGLLGVVVVLVAARTVAVVGVLRLGLALVAGQLLGAVLLDLVRPVPGAALGLPTAAAAGLTLLAVVVSGRSDPRTRREQP